MAVAEGGSWMWVGRLRQASESLYREVRWLGSEVSGPFSTVLRMAASDVWGGAFAEQLQGTIRSFDRQLVPCVEHLGRLQRALEDAARDAEVAARAEAGGLAAPLDPVGVLAPWRVWPAAPWPLDPGWAAPGGRPATLVWVYPERARQLAVGLRQVAEQLRAGRNRLADVLAPLLIDAPPCFEPLAGGAEAVAAEVDRRVAVLEEADRRVAGSFGELGAGLGFPGALAPTWAYDPAGQPTALTVTGPDGGLCEWTLVHDADGNRIRATRRPGPAAPGVTLAYRYDELGRLLRADSPSGIDGFTWDRAGNLLDGADVAYDAADQLLADDAAQYRHDDAGNLTARIPTDDSPRCCDYDSLGRLVRLTVAGTHAGFAYDGLGRRVTRTDDDQRVLRVYDGASVIAEADDHDNLTFETTAWAPRARPPRPLRAPLPPP